MAWQWAETGAGSRHLGDIAAFATSSIPSLGYLWGEEASLNLGGGRAFPPLTAFHLGMAAACMAYPSLHLSKNKTKTWHVGGRLLNTFIQ